MEISEDGAAQVAPAPFVEDAAFSEADASDRDESAPQRQYVFALGRIEPRIPSRAVEKEIAQVIARTDTSGMTDARSMREVLLDRANRYLVRQLCWVLSIQGLEAYILLPRDPADLDLLVAAMRPEPRPTDIDAVVGLRGPIADAGMCNGLMVPVVAVDQFYSFDVDSFVASIPAPEGQVEEEFRPSAEELFWRIMQLADNLGATDDHRAVNYLAVRYAAIYARTAEAHAQNASLSSVRVQPSNLSETRNIVDVIFSYTNRQTDVTTQDFVRVDVTEEFPFLVTKLTPYFDR